MSSSPYFAGTFRPLHVGDTFTARAGLLSVEFRVEEIRVSGGGGGDEEGEEGEEAQFCVVTDDTVIDCEGDIYSMVPRAEGFIIHRCIYVCMCVSTTGNVERFDLVECCHGGFSSRKGIGGRGRGDKTKW